MATATEILPEGSAGIAGMGNPPRATLPATPAPSETATPAPTATATAKPLSSGEKLNESGYAVSASYGLQSGVEFKQVEGAGIGSDQVLVAGYSDALDVYGYVEQGVEVCFPGSGALVFLDASTSPRRLRSLDAYAKEGMTCATIDSAGTVVLQGASSGQSSAPAPATSTPTTAVLSYCQVKTTDILNLRASPNGRVIGYVAYNATLRATERQAGWYKVRVDGLVGWISADYVKTSALCAVSRLQASSAA